MTQQSKEISDWESLLYRYFDGEVSEEERRSVENELEKPDSEASQFLSQLSLIQGEVRKWHHEAAQEIEKDYKPGFSYRHIESKGAEKKESFFGSIFGKQVMLGVGFAAGFAFFLFNLFTLKETNPDLQALKSKNGMEARLAMQASNSKAVGSDAVGLEIVELDDSQLRSEIPSTPALELDDPQPNKELLEVARDDSKDETLPRLDETERLAMQSESQPPVAQVPVVNSSAPTGGTTTAGNGQQATGQLGEEISVANNNVARNLKMKSLNRRDRQGVVVANRGGVVLSVDWVKPAQGYTHRLVSPDSGGGSPVIWVSKQDGLR